MKTKFVLALTVILLLPLPTIDSMVASASPSTTIYVDPPEIITQFSENLTVNINIANVIDLFAWQTKVKWNPQILDFVNATEGDFLKTVGPTMCRWAVNETEGWISISSHADIDIFPFTGVSGNGTLSKITVIGASLGECHVELSHTWLIASTPAPAPGETYGDVDGNSKVDIIDASEIAWSWGTSEGDPRYNPNADFNNDGFIDIFDLTYIFFNWENMYPDDESSKPVEISHEVSDGHVTITSARVSAISPGANVTVSPTTGLTLTFDNVESAGYVIEQDTLTPSAPALGNLVGNYCDIAVTAKYSGNVMIGLAYDDTDMTLNRESTLQMMQYTPLVGDIVDYGQVNIMDIALIAASFGTTPANPRWNATADINGDGNINIQDIGTCSVNFGKTAEWTNITTYVDTELNIVRGETTHFSIIGIH